MKKRRLKRNAVIYIMFEERCNATQIYFDSKRRNKKTVIDDSQLIYELIEERMMRQYTSVRSSIFEIIDNRQLFKNFEKESRAGDKFGLYEAMEKDSIYQFNQYFCVEYPLADILHDIGAGDVCDITHNGELSVIDPDGFNQTYPAFDPPKQYKLEPMLELLENLYGKNFNLNKKSFNMPMIRPKKRYSNWNANMLMAIDPTKPREEAYLLVDAIFDAFQNDIHHMKPLDEALGVEPPRKLKIYKTIEEYNIFKVNANKPFAYRFADALFIYDCVRLGEGKEYAKREINSYWHSIQREVARKQYIADNTGCSEIEIEEYCNNNVKYKKMSTTTYDDLLALAERIMGREFDEFLSGIQEA